MSTPRRSLLLDDPIAANPSTRPTGHRSDGRLRELPLSQIHPNADQPRNHFDKTSLNALADSIRERGVLQPIIVTSISDAQFRIVAGERRWRAATLAGLATIPALIDAESDDATSLQLALIENVVREDLTPIEEARAIATLLDDLGLTTAALARQLGRSRADVAHTTRLLELPDEAIELIDNGVLSKGHGKALLTEPDHARRRTLTRTAAKETWSVRTLQREIATPANKTRHRQPPHPDHTAAAERLEITLARTAGIEATARPHRLGFQIVLDHDAAERLRQLLDP